MRILRRRVQICSKTETRRNPTNLTISADADGCIGNFPVLNLRNGNLLLNCFSRYGT